MIVSSNFSGRFERGMVLVTSLLLLLVVTIMALSMYRSFGMQAMVAGNIREHQRALQAAETAQEYAEWWLSSGNATSSPTVCNSLVNGNISSLVQICSNKLPDIVLANNSQIGDMNWTVGASSVPVGATYTPATLDSSETFTVGSPSLSSLNTYYALPRFYISDMGSSGDSSVPGEIYQIDAAGYGANSNTAAVVESTYAVYVTSRDTTL